MSSNQPTSRERKLSLAPLTPEQALAALLKVDPADVAKLEGETKSPRPKRAVARKRTPKKK